MLKNEGRGILGNWDATGEEIRQAMGYAAAAAIREHKLAGRSIVVWDRENERVVTIPPEEIEVPDPAADDVDSPSLKA